MPKPTVKPTKGREVTRSELAALFGVALSTVSTWEQRGCPAIKRGVKNSEWQCNTAGVHKWLTEEAVGIATGNRDEDAEALSKRKLRAQTELAELDLAKAKEEVIDLDMAERSLAYALSSLQASLRIIPGRVVSALIGETDKTRFKEVLLAEIDATLDQLAKTDLTGLPVDEEGDDDEPGDVEEAPE